MKTYAYGFPRLGENREYKKLIENYWNKEIGEQELKQGIQKLEAHRIETYRKYVDKFPAGEMTYYDNMLDTALMFGIYKCSASPVSGRKGELDEYFDLCRGKNALELTKWFNTNYHYLVPAILSTRFEVVWNKPKLYLEQNNSGIPYIIGPFTFLKLSKGFSEKRLDDYLIPLAYAYKDLSKGFEEMHIEEPAFVLETSKEEINSIKSAYKIIAGGNSRINLFTFYDSVDFLDDLYEFPVNAIGIDFVNGKDNLENIKKLGFPQDKTLIAGLVNGRNAWKTNIKNAVETLTFLSNMRKI